MARSTLERLVAFSLRSFSNFLLALLSVAQRCRGGGRVNNCRPLPPATEPLLLHSGVQLASRIRRRQVKCIEVIQAYINRIRAINPIVNAIVAERFENALAEAQQVDNWLAEGSEDEKTLEETVPFLGVPFTVKEAFSLEGLPNSSGLVNRKNVIATTDAVVVANLRKAGAIPLGVTNCSELCMWYESNNKLYGITRNPYSVDRIVGGSSGGEACIIAAAGSLMGVGSDIGGSIRMPAFFNGVFGHKPSAGLVPNNGQFPNAEHQRIDFLCTGPICRYAEDLIPMLKVMAGPNISKIKVDEKVSISKMKFYSMEHDGGSPFLSRVDKELTDVQRKVVDFLEIQYGVQVQHVQIHKMKYAFQIWSAMMSFEHNAEKGHGDKEQQSFSELMGNNGKKVIPIWELLKWLLGCSTHTFPAIGLGVVESWAKVNRSGNVNLVNMCQNLRTELTNLLGADGVLLYPSHPKIAPKHHQPIFMPFNFAYTAVFNVVGLPVTQCPLGLSKDKLPLGIQLVANHYNDHLCLNVAQELEKAFGGWQNPGSL
uniref:Fatty acid amide hydrolase 2a n=1 Tax=Callorhinchus milii TaxID=7868 RepID=A0A4W3H7G9_CALMI